MSGTGSLMIRNLRKPSDYSKGVMTQDELLRIAISNDANVADARKSFQSGEIQPVLPQQSKSPAELQADTALQEKTALDNLLKLFSYREAGEIIGMLNPDELFVLNQTFPQIQKDISSRFNTKLLSPSFFVEYLRKFREELDASKGVSGNLSTITNKFNDLTDNINDLRAILPTKNQFTMLGNYIEERFDRLPISVVAPLLHRIQELQNRIPSNDEFRALAEQQSVRQFELLNRLSTITANMPTQEQLNRIIEDIRSGRVDVMVGFHEIEDAISGVSNKQLEDLDELRRDIAELTRPRGIGEQLDIQSQVLVGTPNVYRIALAKAPTLAGTPGQAVNLYVINADGTNKKITLDGLRGLLTANEGFRNWYATNVGGGANLGNLRDYVRSNTISAPSAVSSTTGTTAETQGFGLKKAKNGRIKTLKIGNGVAYEPEPNYRQFGKYVINIPQLKERDILNVKFPSLGRIPQFKPTPISDVFKEFLLDLLETGKVSNRIYDQIPVEERQLFERIATGAGIIHNLKIKKTLTDEDKQDNERFAILKGEYLAGNNSVALMKELRKLVVKFMSQGKISKTDGMNLLIELSV